MAELTISSDGDYKLYPNSKSNVTNFGLTTVMITSNIDGATLTFGLADKSGNFIAYPDGAITTGDTIFHGKGITLMVRVSGITANPVDLIYTPSL